MSLMLINFQKDSRWSGNLGNWVKSKISILQITENTRSEENNITYLLLKGRKFLVCTLQISGFNKRESV